MRRPTVSTPGERWMMPMELWTIANRLSRLIKPFIPLSISHDPIIPSDPLESFEGAGMGRIAKLSEPLDTGRAIKMVKEHLSLDFIQLAEPQPDVRKPIKSVAVCAGSGGSVFKGVEADLLITGEMSHVRSYLINYPCRAFFPFFPFPSPLIPY